MREDEDCQVINVKGVAVMYVKIWLLDMPLPELRCKQDHFGKDSSTDFI